MRFERGEPDGSGAAGLIGIFFPRSGFESVPCLVAGLEMLCEAGFAVDVFTPGDTEGASTLSYFAGSRRIARPLLEASVDRPRNARWIPYRIYEPIAEPLVRARRRRALIRDLEVESVSSRRYTCLIGVDSEGLVEAEAWSTYLRVPYLSWSLEILIGGELRSRSLRGLKQREIRANRDAILNIVQDEGRAALLAAENEIPLDRLALVPNSYRGQARRRKSRFVQDLLDISASDTVVLSPGSVAPWAMSEELVRNAADWPEGFVLVVHSRFQVSDNAYARRLMAVADPTRVRFSTRPLAPDEYEALVDSADIGVALYAPQPRERYDQGNLRMLGLSSGKLAAFLRAGVPAVVSRLKGAADLVESYRCGEVIENMDELPRALCSIRERSSYLSPNAIRAFDEVLSMDRRFAPVVDFLRTLIDRT